MAHKWAGDLAETFSGAYGETDTTLLPSIGLLPWTYDANSILQTDHLFTEKKGSKNYSITKSPNLNEGFIICAGNAGDEISWEPAFDNLIWDGSNSNISDHNFYLLLSVGPQGDVDQALPTGSEYIIPTGFADHNVLVDERSEKITWTMPKDGIVYMKLVPVETISSGTKWSIDLDLENCYSYLYNSK